MKKTLATLLLFALTSGALATETNPFPWINGPGSSESTLTGWIHSSFENGPNIWRVKTIITVYSIADTWYNEALGTAEYRDYLSYSLERTAYSLAQAAWVRSLAPVAGRRYPSRPFRGA